MTRIGEPLFNYYKLQNFGFDLNQNQSIEPNERIDLNEDQTISLDEYHNFVERNSNQLSRQIMNDVLSEIYDAIRFLDNLQSHYYDFSSLDIYNYSLETVLSQNVLASARYEIERSHSRMGRDSEENVQKIKQYYVNMKERLNSLYALTPTEEELDRVVSVIENNYAHGAGFLAPQAPTIQLAFGMPAENDLRVLENFISKYPNHEFAYVIQVILANLYLRADEDEKALDLCRNIRVPFIYASSADVGERVENASEFEGFEAPQVKEAFDKVVENLGAYLPENFDRVVVGHVLLELGQEAAANQVFEDAGQKLFPSGLSVKPQNIDEIYIHALPVFLQTIADAKENFAANHGYPKNQLAEILDIYNLILDEFPFGRNVNEVRLKLADVYKNTGDISSAVQIYNAIPADYEGYGEAQLKIGELYLARGDTDRAIVHFENATQTPENPFNFDLEPRALALSHMGEIHMQRGNYVSAVEVFEESSEVEGTAARLFKVGYAALLAATAARDDYLIGIWFQAEKNTTPQEYAAQIFKRIFNEYSDSPLTQRALLLKDVAESGVEFELRTTSSGRGIAIKKFSGIQGVSLVYIGDSFVPEVMPGNAYLTDEGSLVVSKYFGEFNVTFYRPQDTLPGNNDALLKACRILPDVFFQGFKRMYFTGEDGEVAGSYYEDEDEVQIYQSSKPLGTIVHELGHHWDLSVSRGLSGSQLGFGDLSNVLYDISWTPDKIRREVASDEWRENKPDRTGFDIEDFAEEYGLCNRKEDLATMVEYYVIYGQNLRDRITEQMERGNFELAVKYLFVKYVMPFRGREYPQNGEYLGFAEVEQKLNECLEANPGTVEASTIQALERIKQKSKEMTYK
ncbi:MAG: tetratricopeptide repeat protein [Candidatus Margulisbacteria bacterium]|nr:tetratricopeptide repeat protein [Candidatus Margulisiibacteriota bacterium]MBU1021740.1 tetratricopeptide repeat protein [Candidatus Margulisiibacteriota bacterium]MBU1729486.1 tetratricopeptide repeat protein [Candidatus Margulisiibacteriota bacterium]MBU1955413.1 tetratricopeptide repeat protein [Candidatus Margulisiibacteriota bacterium]